VNRLPAEIKQIYFTFRNRKKGNHEPMWQRNNAGAQRQSCSEGSWGWNTSTRAHSCKLTCFWSTKHLALPPAARWLNNNMPSTAQNSSGWNWILSEGYTYTTGQRLRRNARTRQKDKDVRIAYFVKIRKYHKTHKNPHTTSCKHWKKLGRMQHGNKISAKLNPTFI